MFFIEENKIKELLDKAAAGDKDSFTAVYKTFFAPIFKYIYFRTRDRGESYDLTQDVFVKVYENLSAIASKNSNPAFYFFTVAKNAVIDWVRKKKPVYLEDTETGLLKTESLAAQAERSFILEAINSLPDNQKDAIIFRFVNGLKNEEIAKLLDTSELNVRQLQSRGLKKLRERLLEKGDR